MRPASEIKLVPGYNSGSQEHPCPECKTRSKQHETWCRHYLYQEQYQCPLCQGRPLSQGLPPCDDCQDAQVARRLKAESGS